MAATIVLWGEMLSFAMLQASSDFNGTAQLNTPVKGPGGFTYPVQAGGGLLPVFDYPVKIEQISYKGGGTLTVKQVIGSTEISVGTITTEGALTQILTFPAGAQLKLVSSGATNPVAVVTAREVRYEF